MTAQHTQLRAVLTAGDRLDDITRARMWSQIEDQVAAPAAAPAAPATWKRAATLALGAIAVAAAILLVVRATHPTGEPDGQLSVAADSTLSTRLGPHARTALVGPARLQLLATGDATSVRLDRGTLLAEFTGGAGRSLRIEAGDLVVEIVGTLFAVDVTDARTCVAVAHGTVRVTRGATSSLVTDRQELCSGDAAPHAIPAEVADQLARHEQSLRIADAANPPSRDGRSSAGPPTTASETTTTTATPAIDDANAPRTAATPSTTTTATAPRTATIATPPITNTTTAPRATTTPPTTNTTTAPRATTTPPTTDTTTAPRVTTTPPTTNTTPPPRTAATTTPTTTTTTPRTAAPPSATTTSTASITTPPTTNTTAPRTTTTPSTGDTATAPRTTSTPTSAPPADTGTPRTTTAPTAATTPASDSAAAPSAPERYRAAERALAAGDRAAADRALAQVIELGGALADQALYERARIAYQARAWQAARTHLAALARIAGTPLAEPGRYLDCRIAVEAKAADAERCFTAYRAAYPRSPHDLDVLAVLAQLTYARGGCTAAQPLAHELVTRYPRTDHAAAWRSRCPEAP